MAGTLTHYWVFRRAIATLASGSYTGIIGDIASGEKEMDAQLRRDEASWQSSMGSPYLYSDYSGDLCVRASYGYLGSAGPDVFLPPDDVCDGLSSALGGKIDGEGYSSLMHYNKTGGFLIWFVDRIKKSLRKVKSVEQIQRYRNHYAYILGHISHMAADVVIHPFVNTLAAAYYKNKPTQFENSEGYTEKDAWKIHHKVEHYQDSYVRAKHFEDELKFPHDWEVINFPKTAASNVCGYTKETECGKKKPFLVRMLENYYKWIDLSLYVDSLPQEELRKMEYFKDCNPCALFSYRNYYINVIPSRAKMEKHKARLVQPETFERFVDRAVDLAVRMMTEAIDYFPEDHDHKNTTRQDRKDLYAQKRDAFPLLSRNWNLDCGIGLEFTRLRNTATFRAGNRILHIPLGLHLTADTM